MTWTAVDSVKPRARAISGHRLMTPTSAHGRPTGEQPGVWLCLSGCDDCDRTQAYYPLSASVTRGEYVMVYEASATTVTVTPLSLTSSGGAGHAVCVCGQVSAAHLRTRAARRSWFDEHKRRVIAEEIEASLARSRRVADSLKQRLAQSR